MLDIPCVIFAGGKSSRMGEDKALLPFAGFSTLTEFQYSRLSKIFKTVYISCRDKKKFDFSAKFIEDEKGLEVFAPTAGFIASYKEIQEKRFFVLSVDAPFVDVEIFQKIYDEDREESDATIAKSAYGTQPLCGIYHKTLAKKFLQMQEENSHKLGYLLKNSHTNYVEFKNQEKFLNLNHPDEYKTALEIISN